MKASRAMNEHPIVAKLRGGKGWSTGLAVAVAEEVLGTPELFGALFGGLGHGEPLTRMRVAYAISKIAEHRPDLLASYKSDFIDRLAASDNSHLARACMLQTLHHF